MSLKMKLFQQQMITLQKKHSSETCQQLSINFPNIVQMTPMTINNCHLLRFLTHGACSCDYLKHWSTKWILTCKFNITIQLQRNYSDSPITRYHRFDISTFKKIMYDCCPFTFLTTFLLYSLFAWFCHLREVDPRSGSSLIPSFQTHWPCKGYIVL